MVSNGIEPLTPSQKQFCEMRIKVHANRCARSAAERANSRLKHLHHRLRSRLRSEKHRKLAFLHMNRQIVFGTEHKEQDSDSD